MGKVEINRPVHLAWRDHDYGDFLRLLQFGFEGRPLKTRKKLIREMVEVLEKTMEASRFSLRGEGADSAEEDFARFLRLMHDSARTVDFVVHHEQILQEGTSFLRRFLGASLQEISGLDNYLQARGEQILREMKLLASLAEKAYLDLKARNFEDLDPDGRRRYKLMLASFSDE